MHDATTHRVRNCTGNLLACFEEPTVATDIDAVCNCWSRHSACYVTARCYGMVPQDLYDYCYDELKCTMSQCEASGALRTAAVSGLVLALSIAVAAWLGGPAGAVK
jgi:hypothetical protein